MKRILTFVLILVAGYQLLWRSAAIILLLT